ncbi:MAG: ATP-binding protein [bacterium]
MRISKFQLKLTLIFLLVLLIPAVIATLFTRYLLTIERTGMYADQKVEAVLQETAQIAYDIIEKVGEDCKSIAETVSEKVPIALNSEEQLKKIIDDTVPSGDYLYVTIIRFSKSGHKIVFSNSSEDKSISSSVIKRFIESKSPFFVQEQDNVYGAAPLLIDDEIAGAVLVHQKLKQELVRNIIDLQNLLSVYALKEDLESFIWTGIIALIIVLAIVGVVLAALLARSVTKPILSLVDGMKEVSKGNLDHRVEIKGKDEIAILIESFNSMISQLKASNERLTRVERIAAWRDVARRIAHEIKNPLTPIQLSMYRLKKNIGTEKYVQIFDECYDSIITEVENLRNMVAEFSNFARMPKPRMTSSSINEIIETALNLYTNLPENIVIKMDLAENLPQIMVDNDQIRQVLHNIIGNAVDAMAGGGEIIIRTYQDLDNKITIEISDTGCGMSEETLQKIFTPYFTTKEKGTGLGMSIVAQIIEEHGGEIGIESKEGVGTKVKIKLKAEVENAVEAQV